MSLGSGDRPTVAITLAPTTARTLFRPGSAPRVPAVVPRTSKLRGIPHFAGFWSVKNAMFMSQWKTIHSNTWCEPLVAPRRDYCLALSSWTQLESGGTAALAPPPTCHMCKHVPFVNEVVK